MKEDGGGTWERRQLSGSLGPVTAVGDFVSSYFPVTPFLTPPTQA